MHKGRLAYQGPKIGRGRGQVVSVFTFYTDDTSSIRNIRLAPKRYLHVGLYGISDNVSDILGHVDDQHGSKNEPYLRSTKVRQLMYQDHIITANQFFQGNSATKQNAPSSNELSLHLFSLSKLTNPLSFG